MALRMHPTTIRLTEEDQTFLASFHVAGASTISDKIRAMIEDKRLEQQAGRDYRSALHLANNLIGPLHDSIKIAENEQGLHSQFVRRVMEWTPELVANMMAEGAAEAEQPLDKKTLIRLERALVDQVLRLMDITLQTYIARDTALYATDSLNAERLKPMQKLCRLIENE